MRYFALLLVVWMAALRCVRAVDDDSLPTVDLGYEIHQAASFNVRVSFILFFLFNLALLLTALLV
jgi:hypothetical protein